MHNLVNRNSEIVYTYYNFVKNKDIAEGDMLLRTVFNNIQKRAAKTARSFLSFNISVYEEHM